MSEKKKVSQASKLDIKIERKQRCKGEYNWMSELQSFNVTIDTE